MRISASFQLSALVAAQAVFGAALPKRDTTGPQFLNGQPIDGNGKGGPILGDYTPYPTRYLETAANSRTFRRRHQQANRPRQPG